MSDIPQLTERERLELHDIMMSIAFENEKIERYKMIINLHSDNINKLTKKLGLWKDKINQKLAKFGLDITKVNIDSNTGEIVISNVTQLDQVEKSYGVSQ